MEKGYQITFFTRQDCTVGHQPLGQWLLSVAAELGLKGATVNGALEGVGHDGQVHMIHLYDASEQPLQIIMVVSEAGYHKLSRRLAQEPVSVFCTVSEVVFGTLGAAKAGAGISRPPPEGCRLWRLMRSGGHIGLHFNQPFFKLGF